MGVDLRFLPVDTEGKDGHLYCWSVLSLERRRELWPMIKAVPNKPVQGKVHCFVAGLPDGETGYGEIMEDSYGGILTYSTAQDLYELCEAEPVTDNDVNRAVWAYIGALHPDTKIVLFWH